MSNWELAHVCAYCKALLGSASSTANGLYLLGKSRRREGESEAAFVERAQREHCAKTWFAVGNTAEHSGFVTARLDRDAWTSKHESGWTYQDVTGAHGSILGEFDTESEAQACLDKWLECNDERCYTHGSR